MNALYVQPNLPITGRYPNCWNRTIGTPKVYPPLNMAGPYPSQDRIRISATLQRSQIPKTWIRERREEKPESGALGPLTVSSCDRRGAPLRSQSRTVHHVRGSQPNSHIPRMLPPENVVCISSWCWMSRRGARYRHVRVSLLRGTLMDRLIRERLEDPLRDGPALSTLNRQWKGFCGSLRAL